MIRSKTYVTLAKQVLSCHAHAQNWRRSDHTFTVRVQSCFQNAFETNVNELLIRRPYQQHTHIGLKNVLEAGLPVMF